MDPQSAGEFIDNELRDVAASLTSITQEFSFRADAEHNYPFLFVESREEELGDEDEGNALVQSWTRKGFGVLGVAVANNGNGELKVEAERWTDVLKRTFQAQRRRSRSITIDGTTTTIHDIALSKITPTYDDASSTGLVILEFTITGITSTI